ncbi:MAG: hypothetical protein AAB049_03595 [Nitrospirota bacterium]
MRASSLRGVRRACGVRFGGLSVIAGVLSCGLVACGGPIPSQYLKQAEPGVTLTSLTKRNRTGS